MKAHESFVASALNRKRLYLATTLALATFLIQVLGWAVYGRHNLSGEVPRVVSRDLAFFQRFMQRHWPEHGNTPPFETLRVPRGSVGSTTLERLRTACAEHGVTVLESSGTIPGAETLSFEVAYNTPALGAITSWYSVPGAGVSMRTTFILVVLAWIPVRTVQSAAS